MASRSSNVVSSLLNILSHFPLLLFGSCQLILRRRQLLAEFCSRRKFCGRAIEFFGDLDSIVGILLSELSCRVGCIQRRQRLPVDFVGFLASLLRILLCIVLNVFRRRDLFLFRSLYCFFAFEVPLQTSVIRFAFQVVLCLPYPIIGTLDLILGVSNALVGLAFSVVSLLSHIASRLLLLLVKLLATFF